MKFNDDRPRGFIRFSNTAINQSSVAYSLTEKQLPASRENS